jgi:hypothetical protein
MVIRRSAAAEIRPLVVRLVGSDAVEREAASARLAIIGARATRTLTAALEGTTSPQGQAAILRTLEAIHDPRALAPAARLADSDQADVAAAAVSVLRRFLRHSDAALANAAFERLTSLALDPTRPEPVRAVALEALSDLPADTTGEVLRQLRDDPSRRLRAAATPRADSAPRPGALAEITQASLCPDPTVLRALVANEGSRAPLAVLGRLVEFLRAREEAETASPRRTEWQAARAAVHQVLARRGSRIALYDLREALAAAPGPLPVGFVAALEAIGDASCLDEVAAAYVRARRARDAWWVEHLTALFKHLVSRARLTRRSPAVRRVISRWPQAAEELLPRR